MPIAQDDVLNALKQCYDPEIPVNIVDLGLIYDILFLPSTPGPAGCYRPVDMTLTAQGCPEHVNISAQSGHLADWPHCQPNSISTCFSPNFNSTVLTSHGLPMPKSNA